MCEASLSPQQNDFNEMFFVPHMKHKSDCLKSAYFLISIECERFVEMVLQFTCRRCKRIRRKIVTILNSLVKLVFFSGRTSLAQAEQVKLVLQSQIALKTSLVFINVQQHLQLVAPVCVSTVEVSHFLFYNTIPTFF
jgi:hypothetical protein